MNKMFAEELQQLAIFKDLNLGQLALFTPFLKEAHFSQGALIFDQGADARFLYIVADGEVVVRHRPYDGSVIVVAHLERGGVFGWSAVLGRCTYTSAAECSTPVDVYRVSGTDLHRLYEDYPDIGLLFLEHLAAAASMRLGKAYHHILYLLTRTINGLQDCGNGVADDGNQ